jgi:hypothetical protein
MEPTAVPNFGLCDPKAAAAATGACAEGLCCGTLSGAKDEDDGDKTDDMSMEDDMEKDDMEKDDMEKDDMEKDDMVDGDDKMDEYICMPKETLTAKVVDEIEFGFNTAFTLVDEQFKCIDSAKKLAISGAALITSAFFMS